jgi:hypothetical protein
MGRLRFFPASILSLPTFILDILVSGLDMSLLFLNLNIVVGLVDIIVDDSGFY